MSTQTKRRRSQSRRVYPFDIICTNCDTPVVIAHADHLQFIGRPVELTSSLDGGAYIACYRCHTLVAIDADLLSLR